LNNVLSFLRSTFHPEEGFADLVSLKERQISSRNMNKKYNWAGLVPDIFESMADSLNFTFSLELPRDGRMGSEDIYGQWSGIFRDLIDDVADISPTSLTVLQTRSSVVDFLLPFYRTSEMFVIRIELPLPWMIFLNPFCISTWFFVIFFGFILAMSLAILVKLRGDIVQREFSLSKCLTYIAGAFCGFAVRRWSVTPVGFSSR
jgi:hypothetical protein